VESGTEAAVAGTGTEIVVVETATVVVVGTARADAVDVAVSEAPIVREARIVSEAPIASEAPIVSEAPVAIGAVAGGTSVAATDETETPTVRSPRRSASSRRWLRKPPSTCDTMPSRMRPGSAPRARETVR
jgi:hypothetical protein